MFLFLAPRFAVNQPKVEKIEGDAGGYNKDGYQDDDE